jgi:hypothetical protein
MNIGKVLAVSAVAGMLMGTAACGGSTPPAQGDPNATQQKSSCSGAGGTQKTSCSASGASSAAPTATGTGTPAPTK